MAKVRTRQRGAAARLQSDAASASASEAVVASPVVKFDASTQISSDSGLEILTGEHKGTRVPLLADQIFTREAILVLGMHRSGTSAVTGSIVRSGATGPTTPMVADRGNERGYFESVPFMVLHEQLLASAGSCWDDWRRLAPAWLSSFEAEKFRAEARKLLLDEFGDAKLFVLKDPRACRFVPFWKGVLTEARAALRVVIPLRSPIAVAQSLRKRDGMPLTKGLLLWLRHALEAERETRDAPRSIVIMEEFLSGWRNDLARIADEIGVTWPNSIEEAAPEIDAFLSIDLVHQNATEDQHPTLHSWALRAYKAMRALAYQPDAPHHLATLDEIALAFEASCELFGPLLNETMAEFETLRGSEASAREGADAARQQLEDARSAMESQRGQEAEHLRALESMLSEAQATAKEATAHLSKASAVAEAERSAAAEHVASLSMALSALSANSTDRETMVARLSQDITEAEVRFNTLRQTMHGQEAELDRLQAELDIQRRRSVGDEARLALLDRLHREQAEACIEARRQLVEERDRADGAIRDLASRSSTIDILDTGLREERALRSNLETRNSALAESVIRIQERLDSVSRQLDLRDKELTEAREAVTRADQRLAQESGRADEAETANTALTEAMQRADGRLEAQAQRLVAIEHTLDRASSEQARLSAELEASIKVAHLADERAAEAHRASEMAESERATLTARLDAATRSLMQAQADSRHSAETVEHLTQALQSEVQHRERGDFLRDNELKALLKSASWQLTHPLRSVTRALSRLKRRLCHGRKNPLFDTNWYLEQYRDVRLSGWEPYSHYLRYGTAEGRNPNPLFDTKWYLQQNPDVRESGMNPLLHYWRYGKKEGRAYSATLGLAPRPEGLPSLLGGSLNLEPQSEMPANPVEHSSHVGSHFSQSLQEARFSEQGVSPLANANWSFGPTVSPTVAEGEVNARPSPVSSRDATPSHESTIDIGIQRLLPQLAAHAREYGPIDALILLPLLGLGGSEKVAMSFSRLLLDSHPNYSVLVLVTDRDFIDPNFVLQKGVLALKLVDFLPNNSYELKEIFVLRIIQLLVPRITHIINSEVGWNLVRDHGARVGKLTSVFGSMFCLQRDISSGQLVGFAPTYFNVIAPHVKAIISDNETFLDELRALYPGAASSTIIQTVYNPARLDNGGELPFNSEVSLTDRPSILWAGRLDRQKRVEALVETAAALPDFDFFVYGTAVTDGVAAIQNLPNIFVEGPFSSPSQLFQKRSYHAYMHTTREEGLPNILLEVGERRIPIVAPAIGGIPELISAETGFLLSPWPDGEEYATALRSTVANRRDALYRADRLRDLIAYRHSWKYFSTQVIELPTYVKSEL